MPAGPAISEPASAQLFDVGLDYDLAAKTRLSFYVAGVRGGGVQAAIYPSAGSHPGASFLYLELLQRF